MARRRPAAYAIAATIIGTLTLLSLLPAVVMVRTGAGSYVEHLGAYSLAMLILLRLFSPPRHPAIAAAMIVLAGLLELLQHLSIGRTPDLPTFLYSTIGVLGAFLAVRLSLARRIV
jgi:hypothetical protein